jgi:hypothetical protein
MQKFLTVILCLFLVSTLVISLSCTEKEEAPPAPMEQVAPAEEAPPTPMEQVTPPEEAPPTPMEEVTPPEEAPPAEEHH